VQNEGKEDNDNSDELSALVVVKNERAKVTTNPPSLDYFEKQLHTSFFRSLFLLPLSLHFFMLHLSALGASS